jgi:colanic acid/amylovoran biosynthesis glycosyltransferase
VRRSSILAAAALWWAQVTEMDGITTLQLFGEFPWSSHHWVTLLVSKMPATRVLIAAREFRLGNGYLESAAYIDYPFRLVRSRYRTLPDRLADRFARLALRLYPAYVCAHARTAQIAHAHFGNTGWEYRAIARRLRVPYVVSFYGYDYSQYPRRDPAWYERYRRMFGFAAAVCAEGNTGRRQLCDLGCPPEKAVVLHLGVDTDGIPASARVKPTGELRLVQVANFVEKKGHRYTIEAFFRALESCPNMSLTLVGAEGQGAIRHQLMTTVATHRQGHRVHFVEPVAYAQLHAFLKDYHVLIQPSCTARDGDCEGGAPVALLDAQATGMPVIATRHCDIEEEVVDGVSGLLCEEGCVDGLTEAVTTFYHMGMDAFAQFGERARMHVCAEYNVTKCAIALRDLYAALIRGRGRQ